MSRETKLRELLIDDHGHVVVVGFDRKAGATDAHLVGGKLCIAVDPSSECRLTTGSLKKKMGDHPISSIVVECNWNTYDIEDVLSSGGDLHLRAETGFIPDYCASRSDVEYRRRWPGLPQEGGTENRLISMMTGAIFADEWGHYDGGHAAHEFLENLPWVLEKVVDEMYRQRKSDGKDASLPPAIK